jgi:hypothetical protein
MPLQRPDTGGRLLPYVCPFGIHVGPSSRHTGRFTAAANFGGSSLSFLAAASVYGTRAVLREPLRERDVATDSSGSVTTCPAT